MRRLADDKLINEFDERITALEAEGPAIKYKGGTGINISGATISVKTDVISTVDYVDQSVTGLATWQEVEEALEDKQDVLTAGANITISGATISATDTTYTAGTNITISANNEISATDTTYSAGTGINIASNTISSKVSFSLSGTELTITNTEV